MRRLSALLPVVAIAGASLVVMGQPAAAAPGVPRDPVAVFAEDFENGQGATPVLVDAYTGAPPVSQTYTADPAWLTACNGYLAARQQVTAPSGCAASLWPTMRNLAAALGQFAGADPEANHAVTAYTAGNPGANKTELRSLAPIPLATGNRFLTFGVDTAAISCQVAHPLLQFYLLDGVTRVPTFSSAIDPCNQYDTTIGGARVGRAESDAPVLFAGSAVGLELVNAQGSGTGNDFALDKVRLLDVTPALDLVATASPVPVGSTATLTFTVTNTTELAVKNGWSFTAALPAGLTATAPATTDCAGTVAGLTVTGSLTAGQVSCSVTIPVTAATAGTYRTCVPTVLGLDAPACAAVRFVPPAYVFDAHAYGAKVITVGPLGASDVTCSAAPATDTDALLDTPVPTGTLGVLTTSASGVEDALGRRTASASARTTGVSLLSGLITADLIEATAVTASSGTGAVTATGTATIGALRVAGVPVVNPPPNLAITIPLVASVVVNEQVPYGTGIRVNALHVRLLTGVDIVISSARSALTPPGGTCPGGGS
ncbi:choice-of-anchor P family protein [Actinokineospora sp. NBRC 105648]|uniref:choice-of-anchor P family protein n=1 Tax=Actinokineospora sp. NBRC 105648 TaxID=3032206 RepID=UPI0024A3B93D|nr:choice-of-anchor P family protein [Actinokineospora sp. NBRC 105648]GLZ39529.1 hypothetical protein Acsp05_31530 [Actinokineospora sp. NBRC 105648]